MGLSEEPAHNGAKQGGSQYRVGLSEEGASTGQGSERSQHKAGLSEQPVQGRELAKGGAR